MAIIAGYKGVIDYYVCSGIPCARRWPRAPAMPRTPEVQAQWPLWTTAAQEWKHLSPDMAAAYKTLAQASGLSGRDLQMRAYITGLYRNPLP